MPNHLANSLSPYLRQHADNPVEWYPWGAEALEKARREQKPIFLSIGYSACHWCHIMAHESFEDPATASLLNTHFISIKVDREERPDLDNLYMSAVVALTGQGGWPMSVFLTPELKPFYGGTYFPRVHQHGLPAFSEVLKAISTAWEHRREEILQDSARLAEHLLQQSGQTRSQEAFQAEDLNTAAHGLIQSYDWQNGGWGGPPKFPQPMLIEFLLRRHLAGDVEALKPALHTLHAMCRGGMFDVVGGGFARYSTDAAWHVPHFEKMLYDNAQLSSIYLHAWQITHEAVFRRVVEATLGFVSRELTSPEGGFYSSLDADSGGLEGQFYAWELDELRQILGTQAEFFETAYGITASGNWEGQNILQRLVDDAGLAAHFSLTQVQVQQRLAECHATLLQARSKRLRPATDDKVLTAWNGLMLSSFAEAGAAFGDKGLLEVAARSADFLLTHLCPADSLRHTWRDGQAGQEVFLEDYASLILGLLALYQADFNPRWFMQAERLGARMVERFNDPLGGFFDTPSEAQIVLERPKDIQDGATPSGNALAAQALLKLAAFTDNELYRAKTESCLGLARRLTAQYPGACGAWLSAADFSLANIRQVAILGSLPDQGSQALLDQVRATYRPNMVLAASDFPPSEGSPALLKERPMLDGQPTAYVCESFVCKLPVTEPEQLTAQLL